MNALPQATGCPPVHTWACPTPRFPLPLPRGRLPGSRLGWAQPMESQQACEWGTCQRVRSGCWFLSLVLCEVTSTRGCPSLEVTHFHDSSLPSGSTGASSGLPVGPGLGTFCCYYRQVSARPLAVSVPPATSLFTFWLYTSLVWLCALPTGIQMHWIRNSIKH